VAEDGVCCENQLGLNFPCGKSSKCCGDACALAKDVCCTGPHGERFPVSGKDHFGDEYDGDYEYDDEYDEEYEYDEYDEYDEEYDGDYEYDEEDYFGDACPAEKTLCVNSKGFEFWCGGDFDCCGDVCVAKDGVCCENSHGMRKFPCGKDSSCCGNVCAGPGSECCTNKFGFSYPVAAGTHCPSE
jgi:hypothetical protein